MPENYPNQLSNLETLITASNQTNKAQIVVIGASGFVGNNLIGELLIKTQVSIRAVARNINNIKAAPNSRLEIMSGDLTSSASMQKCLKGAEVVFFLVHKLESSSSTLIQNEAQVAKEFGRVAKSSGIKRVIYLSGLGVDDDVLSRHLTSRHNTGSILRSYVPIVIELRAGIIIGQGSISFEIIRHLINKLPILILPKYAKTLTQPIGINDVLRYLLASLDLAVEKSEIVEIGGPEKMSYQDLLKSYAKFLGKKRLIICLPILPLWLAGWFLYLLTPKAIAQVGRNMVESFQNEMVVTNNRGQELFPEIIPESVQKTF
jgi:uncharacterized protein YbjT (DUF2867 family)